MAGALWPAARLSRSLRQVSDMDALGSNRVMLFPTWFVRLTLLRDPRTAVTLARAYNDWIDDYCSTDRHRLFPCGIVPLQTVEVSIEELRRIAKPTSRWAGLGREATHIPSTQPNPVRAANDGLGASRPVRTDKPERRLCVRSRDLRRDAMRRGRSAASGPSSHHTGPGRFDLQRSFADPF